MNTQPRDEILVLEDRKLDEGPRGRERVREEVVEAGGGDDEFGDDLIGFEPAELLAAVERDLQAADADRERREAEPVEPHGVVFPGLVHEHQQAEHGEDAERQVDEEHPVPGIGLGQPGPQRRPHDRAHHHAHAPDRHRLGALVQRIGIQHHRLRQRHQRGAEHALQQAEQHHLVDVLRQPAQHRGDREAAGAEDEDALAPETVGDPADRRGHDRGGDDVGGQDPVDLVLRGRQRALHIGQRDIGDGGVQRLHDGRGHGADRHHVPAQAGNGNGRCGHRGHARLILRGFRRREAEQRSERAAMAGVDRGVGAHAGLQLLHVFVVLCRNRSAPARAAPP